MHGTISIFQWSDAVVSDMKERIAQGISAGQFARLHGISRNAAIGKANRIGLHFSSQVRTVRMGGRPRKPATERRQRLEKYRPKVEPVARVPVPEPTPLMKTIVEVTGCRWPVTALPPHFFCGHARESGSAYCNHHTMRAVR